MKKKIGRGRPSKELKDKKIKTSISISHENFKLLRAIGEGFLSRGIEKLLEQSKK